MHQFQHFIINTPELFERLVAYEAAVDSDLMVFDLETDSASERKAQVYGMGMCFTDQKAFYIVWRNKDGSFCFDEPTRNSIIDWLNRALSRKRVVGHNIVYDVLVYKYNFGFNFLDRIISDTILLKHCLNEERPFALKEISPVELGSWADKAQDKLKENVLANGGKWNDDQKDMYLADTDILGEYCCWDVILTILLFNKYDPQIDAQELRKLYEEEVMSLYREVTIPMKDRGFPVDVPYFKDLLKEITQEINSLETNIMNQVAPLVKSFEQEILDKKHPVKSGGNFPKVFAEVMSIPLPQTKDGKITLAAKALQAQKAANPDPHAQVFYDWLLTGDEPPKGGWIDNNRKDVQRKLFFKANPEDQYIFNLSSGDHIGYLIYDKLGIKPFEFTEKGKPSTKADVLDELIEQYKNDQPWMEVLYDYRKLNKIKSTYVEGILDRQINGIVYSSMLQYGTTSGRYSSTNPNLQNLPRIKDEDSGLTELVLKYVNAIKKGFIAPKGYKIVNADYSSLEPVCFAHASGDEKLRDVFRKGEDLYSRIAIDVFNLQGYSALKKDPMYLGKHKKEFRQKSKVFCLAVPYGAEAARISQAMNISWEEANDLINDYLNAYPGLRKYMNVCNFSAKRNGYVKTDFGRIRHLPKAKRFFDTYGDQLLDPIYAKKKGLKDLRREFKNLLNNAKNFPIQGIAAHIVNRAAIAIERAFKAAGIEGGLVIQVHDELTALVKEEYAEQAKDIMRQCMENTTRISVPLVAEPIIADRWSDAK